MFMSAAVSSPVTALLIAASTEMQSRWSAVCDGLGMATVLAEDADVALALIQFQPVNVVLLDACAAVASQAAVIERLRQQPVLQPLPLLVAVHNPSATDAELLLAAGATELVNTPWHEPLLAVRIQQVLNTSVQHQQVSAQRDALLATLQQAGVGSFEWYARRQQLSASPNLGEVLGLAQSRLTGLDSLRHAFGSKEALKIAHLFEGASRTGQVQSAVVAMQNGTPSRLMISARHEQGEVVICGVVQLLDGVLQLAQEAGLLSLPAGATETVAAEAVTEPARAPCVLVVDDSRVSRMLLKSMILAHSPEWVVEEEGDALAALDTASRVKPDLVTMDINMPGRSGLEVAADLRQIYPDLEIVMVSANFQEHNLDRAQTLGLRFLKKPITEQLVAELLEGLQKKR